MCHALQARLPEQIAALRDAVDTRMAQSLRDASHQLGGTLSTFSTTVGDLAAEIEDRAADGDMEAATLLIQQLETLSRSLLLQVSNLSIKDLLALRALRRP